jgi:hypothetical protein
VDQPFLQQFGFRSVFVRVDQSAQVIKGFLISVIHISLLRSHRTGNQPNMAVRMTPAITMDQALNAKFAHG